MSNVVIAEDGKPIASQSYLNMLIVMIKNCERETGMHLMDYLNLFDGVDIDSFDSVKVRSAIHRFMDEHYPPENRPVITKADLVD
jgi:hypothetical protein